MCTNKKKKAHVQEGMQTKQKRENHIQGNNKESCKGVKKKRQTGKKEREVQQSCRSDKEKKDKKRYKGTGNEECNGDENGQKSEQRRRGSKEGRGQEG